MRFNNFLNRLRIRRIYALLTVIAIVLLTAMVLLLRSFFHVPSPDHEFHDYLHAIRDGRYNDAVKHILPEEQDDWYEKFKAEAQDESPESSLRAKLQDLARCELVSQSTLADDHYTLRYQLTAADAEAMLNKVRDEAESGIIDMSDPDVVRVSKDPTGTLLYYVEDNFKEYQDMLRQDQIVVNFYLKGNVFNRRWYIEADEERYQMLSGDLEKAVRNVFRAPLNLPKQ